MASTLTTAALNIPLLTLRVGDDFGYSALKLTIYPRAGSPNIAFQQTCSVDEDGVAHFSGVRTPGADAFFTLSLPGEQTALLSGPCTSLFTLPTFLKRVGKTLVDRSSIAVPDLEPVPEKFFWRLVPVRDPLTNLIQHIDVLKLPGEPNDH